MNTLDRITLNPLVMGGKPCIRGMRITVGNVVGLLAAGHSVGDVIDELPELEEEDIRAALTYASWSVSDFDVPMSPTTIPLTLTETC